MWERLLNEREVSLHAWSVKRIEKSLEHEKEEEVGNGERKSWETHRKMEFARSFSNRLLSSSVPP